MASSSRLKVLVIGGTGNISTPMTRQLLELGHEVVAIDADGRLIGSEEEIVDAKRRNRIDDIHLLSARPTPAELSALSALGRLMPVGGAWPGRRAGRLIERNVLVYRRGWILLLSGHAARHTAQIEEVKTSAGYPAK